MTNPKIPFEAIYSEEGVQGSIVVDHPSDRFDPASIYTLGFEENGKRYKWVGVRPKVSDDGRYIVLLAPPCRPGQTVVLAGSSE